MNPPGFITSVRVGIAGSLLSWPGQTCTAVPLLTPAPASRQWETPINWTNTSEFWLNDEGLVEGALSTCGNVAFPFRKPFPDSLGWEVLLFPSPCQDVLSPISPPLPLFEMMKFFIIKASFSLKTIKIPSFMTQIPVFSKVLYYTYRVSNYCIFQ